MSVERLLQLRDLTQIHGDPDLARWLKYSVDGYLQGDPLDDAFDLRPLPGGRDPRTVYWLNERDRHLRVAWLLLDGSPWLRSESLAQHIRRFAPHWHRHPIAPTGDPVRTALWHAIACGRHVSVTDPLPTTARQLHRICCGTTPSNSCLKNRGPIVTTNIGT